MILHATRGSGGACSGAHVHGAREELLGLLANCGFS